MSDFEIRTDVDGRMVKSKLSCTSAELLQSFSNRVNDVMMAVTEEAISAVMPIGVNVAAWTRTHGVSVGIDCLPNKITHCVYKDGDMVAEVCYRNGVVRSKIFMGRGAMTE